MEPNLRIILFTLDETAYSRELAPLAGAYPALHLGPPWWFFDSYEGIQRFRQATTETCGFYNTVGFNDDTRAFCSIPARHDVARRSDCTYLATQVATGRLSQRDAMSVIHDLSYGLAKNAYNL
jgi:glucuronate isomerase